MPGLSMAIRRQMTAIAHKDENRLKGVLKATKGKGTGGFEGLSDDEIILLYCYLQSHPSIGEHCGISRSSVATSMSNRGLTADRLRRFVEDTIDDILVTENIEVESLSAINQSELDRLTSQIEYYRKKYDSEKKLNEKLSNGYNLYRDIISDTITEFDEVPAAYPTTIPSGCNDEELCILPISDTQIGSCVLPERLGGLAQYNWEVFLHRIEEYKRGVNSIINEHLRLSYPIKTALVFLLGDICEGETIFPNQMSQLDLSLTKQIFDGGLRIAELLRWMSSQFENVRVFSVVGNHGNVKGTTLNTDYIMYLMMAQALAAQKNLEFFISESHYLGLHIDKDQDYIDFQGHDRVWNFLLTHGHQAKSYNGLPFYSLERLVRKYSSMTGILWDKLFVGHHHQDVPGPRSAWAINGSWVGGTEYSQEKMQGNDQPCQRIWGFHPKRGLTWTYPIDLDKEMRLEMRQDDNGIYTPVTTVVPTDGGGYEFSLAAGGFSTE